MRLYQSVLTSFYRIIDRKSSCIFIILLIFSNKTSAQVILTLNNLETNSSIDIQKGDFIKCRFMVDKFNNFLAGGIVQHTTDSSIIYKSRFSALKEIKISSITNIDRVPFKRNVLPSLVTGVLLGIIDKSFNKKQDLNITGLILTGGILLELNYVYLINNKILNKNRLSSNLYISTKSERNHY